MKPSLYLSQSYSDAWDEYKRSMSNASVPVWDYIILTARNEHQAQSYQAQIDSRKEYLPSRSVVGIVPDEGGVRVGSGGATLSVLKWLKERGGWESDETMKRYIHALEQKKNEFAEQASAAFQTDLL